MLAKRQGWVLAAAGPVLVLMAGCVTMDNKVPEAPPGTPVQAWTRWQNYVITGSDPYHGGAPVPGLAGRLYLSDVKTAVPLIMTGKVEVRLYPDPPDPKEPDRPLQVWQLDAETLKGKLQRDVVGWGYSLLLPWVDYSPEVTRVRLTIRFDPAKGGTSVFAPEERLTLQSQGPPQITASTRMPGAAPNAMASAAPAVASKPAN